MPSIASLWVDFRASTASFVGDLGRVRQLSFNTSKEVQRSFKVMGAAVVAGLGAAASAATALTLRAIDTADKMNKMAQGAGLTVEQMSALAYQAKLADVSTEQLATALAAFSQRLDMAKNSTRETQTTMRALRQLFGDSVPTFTSTDDALRQIADRFQSMPDSLGKTGIAANLFGATLGSKLIPLLNEGSEGFVRAAEEAGAFGAVISTTTARQAERFNDQMQRVRVAIAGVFLRLANDLLPHLGRLADSLVNVTMNAAKLQQTSTFLRNSVQTLATAVIGLGGSALLAGDLLANLLFVLVALAKAPKPGGFFGPEQVKDFNRALAEVRASASITGEHFSNLREMLAGIWAPVTQGTKDVETALARIGPQIEAPLTSAEKKIKATIDGLRLQVATFGLSEAAAARLKAQREGASAVEQGIIFSLTRQLELMKMASDVMPQPIARQRIVADVEVPELPFIAPEIDLSQFKIQGLDDQLRDMAHALNREYRPAAERYREEMEKLQLLYEHGLNAEVFLQLQDRLKEQFSTTRAAVIEVRQAMDEMFTRAIFRAESAREAFGNLLERIGEMIFQLKVMKPLLDGLFEGGSGGGGILGKIGGAIAGALGGGATQAFMPIEFGGPLFPGFANGGFATAGQPILVGERGPETFIPRTSGMVIPNHKLDGGSVSIAITNNVNASGAAPGSEAAIRRALKETSDITVARTLAIWERRRRSAPAFAR